MTNYEERITAFYSAAKAPKQEASALRPAMTPNKAIELLGECCGFRSFTLCSDFYEAVRLGRDALIRYQRELEAGSQKET